MKPNFLSCNKSTKMSYTSGTTDSETTYSETAYSEAAYSETIHSETTYSETTDNTEAKRKRDDIDAETAPLAKVKQKRCSHEIEKQWTLLKLYRQISEEPLAIRLAEELGLIPTKKICRNHHCPMPIYKRGKGAGIFQCNKGECRNKNKLGRASDTFFEHARLPVSRVFYLMYCFCSKYSYDAVKTEDFTSPKSYVSTRTISDWYNLCREVIVDHFIANFEMTGKIGGPGCVVQIDQIKFGRRQHKGRQVDGHWVLGIYEDGSEDLRLELCPNNMKSAEVLIPLVKKHVIEGSTIHTDHWKSYYCLKDHGYVHKEVIEGDPNNTEEESHMKLIDSQWKVVKRSFYDDKYPLNFSDWIVEHQWRRNIKKKHLDPFDELIKSIVHLYGDFRKKF